eukprot:m.172455 g.172455  ORF g.172455 m.172455 type:complete len:1227 (+) comp17859_c0_seq1:103-3783(+)
MAAVQGTQRHQQHQQHEPHHPCNHRGDSHATDMSDVGHCSARQGDGPTLAPSTSAPVTVPSPRTQRDSAHHHHGHRHHGHHNHDHHEPQLQQSQSPLSSLSSSFPSLADLSSQWSNAVGVLTARVSSFGGSDGSSDGSSDGGSDGSSDGHSDDDDGKSTGGVDFDNDAVAGGPQPQSTAALLAASLQTSMQMMARAAAARVRTASFSMSGEPALSSAEPPTSTDTQASTGHDARQVRQQHQLRPPQSPSQHALSLTTSGRVLAQATVPAQGGSAYLPVASPAATPPTTNPNEQETPQPLVAAADEPMTSQPVATEVAPGPPAGTAAGSSAAVDTDAAEGDTVPLVAATDLMPKSPDNADATFGYDDLPIVEGLLSFRKGIQQQMMQTARVLSSETAARVVDQLERGVSLDESSVDSTPHDDSTYGYDDILAPLGQRFHGALDRIADSISQGVADEPGRADESNGRAGFAVASANNSGASSNASGNGLTEDPVVRGETLLSHQAAAASGEADSATTPLRTLSTPAAGSESATSPDNDTATIGYDDLDMAAAQQQLPLPPSIVNLAQRVADATPSLQLLADQETRQAVVDRARATARAIRENVLAATQSLRERAASLTSSTPNPPVPQTAFHRDLLTSPNLLRSASAVSADAATTSSSSHSLEPRLEAQYVQRVLNFSSQYGLNSYSAANLVGPPRVFPQYGDFTLAFVSRNYGCWWQRAPSFPGAISSFSHRFPLTDFVEIRFDKMVVPTKVTVFETYNPGAIVKILACTPNDLGGKASWFVLWSGKPQHDLPAESRAFSPELRVAPFATNTLRLELDHRHLDYYAELDAVLLEGFATDEVEKPAQVADPDTVAELSRSNRSLLRRLSTSDTQETVFKGPCGPFDALPDELVLHILSFLSFLDVLSFSCVCRRFFAVGSKAHEGFMALDLQPCWVHVTDRFLYSISSRCTSMTKLNLSWTGGGPGLLSAQGFSRFLSHAGNTLEVLRLACCSFVDDRSLVTIVETCPRLFELDLQCCTGIKPATFEFLASLPELTRLNLYNTQVTQEGLMAIFRRCTKLQHVNVGHCGYVTGQWDEVLEVLAACCRDLRSLDVWRARSLTARGVLALAQHCHELRELDIGWCRFVDCAECVPQLAASCPNLEKLFLTALRSTTDDCITALAASCPNLRQLDVLGAAMVQRVVVQRLLESCDHVELLDVSFCRNIDFATVRAWREEFPDVAIKKSFAS